MESTAPTKLETTRCTFGKTGGDEKGHQHRHHALGDGRIVDLLARPVGDETGTDGGGNFRSLGGDGRGRRH